MTGFGETKPARCVSSARSYLTVSTPWRYNLPAAASPKEYSPQFWQTAAGASRTMTTVLPRRKVTVTISTAVSPSLQMMHFMSEFPLLTSLPYSRIIRRCIRKVQSKFFQTGHNCCQPTGLMPAMSAGITSHDRDARYSFQAIENGRLLHRNRIQRRCGRVGGQRTAMREFFIFRGLLCRGIGLALGARGDDGFDRRQRNGRDGGKLAGFTGSCCQLLRCGQACGRDFGHWVRGLAYCRDWLINCWRHFDCDDRKRHTRFARMYLRLIVRRCVITLRRPLEQGVELRLGDAGLHSAGIGDAKLLRDDALGGERSRKCRNGRLEVGDPLPDRHDDFRNRIEQDVLQGRRVRGTNRRAARRGREHKQRQAENVASASHQEIQYTFHIFLRGH